jgi:uncharacterized repeat protein (TIGR01451 family)
MIFTETISIAATTINTATVTGSDDLGNVATSSDSAQVTVLFVGADLSVTKTAEPAQVYEGDAIIYTLIVSNAGPEAAVAVVVTDTLPAGATFVSAGVGCTENAGMVVCEIAGLAVDASQTITIVMDAPAGGGAITNTAVVAAETLDPNTENNTAAAQTMVLRYVRLYLPVITKAALAGR